MYKCLIVILLNICCLRCAVAAPVDHQQANVLKVAQAKGLVAFWDFNHANNDQWIAVNDPTVNVAAFPISLRQVGDPLSYTLKTWPYQDTQSRVLYDSSGPFGHGVRFNRGHIYGAVERDAFDKSLLDIRGYQAFTMISWVKFVGQRHMVAGIWDEGGWDRYSGRRQVALFAGLFNQKGTIAHISATGAASYPQSNRFIVVFETVGFCTCFE